MPLNEKQKEAVEYLSGPLLVLAGPGTGKTQLLSSKVKFILEETDTNPENILCLTFTESGAQNMRDRLKSMVREAATKVNIHTYHAFGAEILGMYRNYATEMTKRYDAAIDEVAQYKIVKKIQDELPGTDILKGDKIRDIIDTIGSAKTAGLSAEDLRIIAEDNLRVSEKVNEEIQEPLQFLVQRMKFNDAVEQVYRPIAEILAKYMKVDKIRGKIEREVNAVLLELNEAIQEGREMEKPSVKVLSAWKDHNLEVGGDGKYRLKNLIANKKLVSLAGIMEKYNQYLEENGLYDFSDMIEEAIRLLREDDGFRATLSERFQYILLDEFQDTNPSEVEIVYQLTDYEDPVVMAVGDDDQAIFEFQGANASNLLEFQAHYQAKVVMLTENYRSTAKILDFSHKIAEQVEGSFARNRNILKKLTAKNEKILAESVEVAREEFLTSEMEYEFVARRIQKLLEAGEEAKEIAVIAPKHKYLIPMIPFLKAKGIEIDYEKRENVLEDKRVAELMLMAKFVYELREGEADIRKLSEVLGLEFFQIPAMEILRFCQRDREKRTVMDYISSAKEGTRIYRVLNFLAEEAIQSREKPLEILLNELLGETVNEGENEFRSPFLEYYTEKTDDFSKFDFYAKLGVVRAKLKERIREDRALKIEDLLEFLEDYEAAGAMIVSTSPYRDSENAVKLLTAHKSKGLEFRHVFIVSTDDYAWGNSKGNNNLLSLPKNLIQIRHTGATDDERLRLFFVAVTRAKVGLIISNAQTDFSGKSHGRLDYLKEFIDGDGKINSPLIGREVQVHLDENEFLSEIPEEIASGWMAEFMEPKPELMEILREKVKNYRLSASDLTSFINIRDAGPVEFYKSRLLGIPGEPLTKQLAMGNLMHAALEQVTTARISEGEVVEMLERQAETLPLLAREIQEVKEKGAEALKAVLKQFGEIIRSGKAEVNLGIEQPTIGEMRMNGVIDHLKIDEATKEIEIYDFKTGRASGAKTGKKWAKWNSDPKYYAYRLQLGFYKLLVNNSRSYANYKVRRGHILFVMPDAEGKIWDAEYEFNQEDEAELVKLATNVYQMIRDLSFMERPEVFVESEAGAGMPRIREFVEGILGG
ncbi:MAG: ATP-dependent DNA helicase [Candidatus Saccharibacteria bacterium]|nr:ATP-dependent DNA helicase [Candidatus Saccharibacteria bacterium]